MRGGSSSLTIRNEQEDSSRDGRKDELDEKTDQLLSTNHSTGLKNSVISVIPVIDARSKNTKTIENIDKILPQFDEDKLYRKWTGGDIWGCNSCNDRGDRWYMQKHPCKDNKKR